MEPVSKLKRYRKEVGNLLQVLLTNIPNLIKNISDIINVDIRKVFTLFSFNKKGVNTKFCFKENSIF